MAVALAAGLFMSRLSKPLGLPSVTAYLVAGILIGPYCLGRIGVEGLGFVSGENIASFSLLNDLALGFIAFSIGNEFRLSQLKKIGGKATFIGIFQAVTAALLVDAVLIVMHFTVLGDRLPVSMAIIIGAIAAATAPAATLMVVRQYKAKGKITDLLLPIVAIDDAVGLAIFSVSFGIAQGIESGEVSAVSVVVEPLAEIVFSLAAGAAAGAVFSVAEKAFSSGSKRLALSLMFIILTVAISKIKFALGSVNIGFSPLLTLMMLGTMFCNLCDFSAEIMEKTDRWAGPLLILFFVMSGAELELSILKDLAVIGIGVTYIITRSLGKYAGAFISAKIAGCDKITKKYLGITLLPQAGVALGMSVTVMQSFGEMGAVVRNLVLFSVLVYELAGPLATKLALTAAGEIRPKPEEKDRKNRTAPSKI
ncbi:MAG: cation:proton antiporter [Clostridiales bacterium]|nr:cation:proton antiporter [Clostridiales bacterium]